MKEKNKQAPWLALFFGSFLILLITIYIKNKEAVNFIPWIIAILFVGFMFYLSIKSMLSGEKVYDNDKIMNSDLSDEKKEELLLEKETIMIKRKKIITNLLSGYIIGILVKSMAAILLGSWLIYVTILNPSKNSNMLSTIIFGGFGILLFSAGVKTFFKMNKKMKK